MERSLNGIASRRDIQKSDIFKFDSDLVDRVFEFATIEFFEGFKSTTVKRGSGLLHTI